jgi:hypothetical protein
MLIGLTLMIPTALGASPKSGSIGFDPTQTSYTGIDPGAGQFYSYAPSIVQTNSSTRYLLYCGNTVSGSVHDHILLTVGHLSGGQWRYSSPRIVFGPENDPNPNGFFAYHTCEPELIGGSFHYAGKRYKWALFFTAESAASNSTNQIGVAFANSPAGPYNVDETPIVQTFDDYGHNSYPNDCPTYPSDGQTFYCLGEPAATSIGGGRVVLAYTGNSGSPGSVSSPAVGIVLRELNLSNVPAGPCGTCFVTLPGGQKEIAVPQKGLVTPTKNVALAFDPSTQRFVLSYDAGPQNPDTTGPPVTQVVTVASMSESGLLSGKGTWQIQGNFGQCLSGYVYNHNTGIVRTSNGDIPGGGRLEIIYTVADNDLGTTWGVWGYRMWDVDAPLTTSGQGPDTYAAASASCEGLDSVAKSGSVAVAGSSKNYGSGHTPNASNATVGLVLTADRGGYYLVTQQGQVRTFGDARNQGSVATSNVIGIALDDHTGGYWIAQGDGTVHAFGAASLQVNGSAPPTGPVAAIAGIPNGEGYYLVSTTGQVSAYGNAQFFGSMRVPAGQTVSAVAVTPTGLGYYVVTNDGTIGAYGDAQLFGPATVHTSAPIAAMTVSRSGTGYWLATTTGAVTGFGAVDPKLAQLQLSGPLAALTAS